MSSKEDSDESKDKKAVEMKIFLVGYMGCGKTTMGERLSAALGLEFIDLDDYIVDVEGRSIPQIFEAEGEAGYRGIERRCLTEIVNYEDEVVVATGGGTPCFYDNMAVMNANGLTIYLEMNVSSLRFRLEHSKSERPLIVDLMEDELEDFIRTHLEERKHFYGEAKLTLPGLGFSDKKLESLVSSIVNYSR